MIHYGLTENGKALEFESDKELLNSIDKFKYVLIDTKTSLKGPTYSLVKASKLIKSNNKSLYADLGYVYGGIDVPNELKCNISSNIKIDSLSKQYSINQLVNQMYDFNSFLDDFCITENYIDIIEFSIVNNLDYYSIDVINSSFSQLRKFFKTHNLLTNGNSIGNNSIVFNNGKYHIASDKLKDDKNFDTVFIKINGETFYRLTRKQLNRFNSISNLVLQTFNCPDYKRTLDEDYDEKDPYQGNYSYNVFNASNLKDILKIMLYYPQEYLLNKKVADMRLGIKLSLQLKDRSLDLSITEEEAENGFCLFSIINKLLKL